MKTRERALSPRKVLVKVSTRHVGQTAVASVAIAGDPFAAIGGTLDLELFHYHQQKVLFRRRIRRFGPGRKNEVRFPLSAVASGTCLFRGTFTDRHGCRMPAEIIQDKAAAAPWWLGSREGISSAVPKPWTPLRATRTTGGARVECWGRTYTLDGVSFLKQAASREARLLAGAARFVGSAGGQAISWTGRPPRIIAREAGQVVLEQEARAGNLTLRARTEIDFDGMLRVDCSIAAKRPVRLDSLALEIPIPAARAKYFYRFPGKWWSSENVHALPRAGMKMEFQPFVWLGDEERGFAWFCESDRNWFHNTARPAIEITRRGATVLLRLNLVAAPLRLLPESAGAAEQHTGTGTETSAAFKGGLDYTFGFQATPVKPVEKDAWDYRTFCFDIDACLYEKKTPLQFKPGDIDRMRDAGVRTVVIFESWNDIEAHAVTRHGARLRKLVKACHERGMQALLYFGFLISDIAPEWRDFGKECVVTPKGGYPILHNRPQPDQSAWKVCLRSVWQDHVAAGIGRVMDDFGVDGVYLDGTEYPFACANTLHGCGVVQPDGKISPTYPIFAVRSAMRRIYRAVMSRAPRGQVNVHNSTCMTMPTLGWATSYWDGEQFGQMMNAAGLKNRMPMPLDAFRAEFMGRQWGVPAEFLCYSQPSTFSYEQSWAFCLLHDVPVRPFKAEPDLGIASSIWKAMDEFGRKEAEWLPYWKNAQWVGVSPKGVYAGLYCHPRNGLLLMVTNLSRNRVRAAARLQLRRCGLAADGLTARDALTGSPLPIRDGRIECPLPPLGWRLIRVSAQGR